MAWRDSLRDAVRNIGNFADHCEQLANGYTGWAHADSPALIGLERWGTELAAADRIAAIAALVAAAHSAFPDVVKSGSDQLVDMGVTGDESEPILDGASVQVQLGRALRWLDAQDAAALAAVEQGFDKTRQLYTWDDDLRPADDVAYFWVIDMGQLCSAAILRDTGDADGGGYYEWPYATVVGRGLVIIARSLRMPDASMSTILESMKQAFVIPPA